MAWKGKRVLVFNPNKKLIAIFISGFAAARAFNLHTQSINFACTGKMISANNNYFRYEDENVLIDESDLGTLKLQEYDKLCGVQRKYYNNYSMSRKGMKYNTEKKRKKAAEKAERKRIREEKEAQYREQIRQEVINELKSNQEIEA
jgi:hypothetical protein